MAVLTDDPVRAATAWTAMDLTGATGRPLRLQHEGNGAWRCRFGATPGTYQFSLVVDARDYDWQQTYVNLYEHQNKGQRTGPWDFELHTNRPLVPAYWVELDGHRLGAWFFQRVSLEDMAHRQFRGRTAFFVSTAGEHALRFVPLQPMNVAWSQATLEVDPEDTLEPVPDTLNTASGNVPVAAWSDDAFWARQRQRLGHVASVYDRGMQAALQWASEREEGPDGRVKPILDLPLLVAGERLGVIEGGVSRAVALLDATLARPYWGKCAEGRLGHNGDMGAALLMRAAAWAVHMFRPGELGETRRQRLTDKLAYQGDRYFEQMLLNRDYWGGALRQDHGWRSLWTFGTAALLLHGIVPRATFWLSWVLPRARRCLQAMSRDGMIPPSSHFSLAFYLDELSEFRRTLVRLAGPDIYEQAPFRNIVDYLCAVLHPESNRRQEERDYTMVGAMPFLADMASIHEDGRAAWLLHRQLKEQPTSVDDSNARAAALSSAGYHHSLFWSFFAYADTVAPKPPTGARRRLSYFPDDARVHLRDADEDVTLFVRCGPENGYHAYAHARGPCDRTETAPRAGHFTVYLGGTQMLATPIAGYRVKSLLGSIMLVDDQGQIGDGDYPMGIPSWEHPGERIMWAHMNPSTRRGWVRLDLRPAYPAPLGIRHYTRDLILEPDRRIICRDHVVLDQPRALSWLFHATRKLNIRLLDEQRAAIGHVPRLMIEPHAANLSLRAEVAETDVVHNYTSSFEPFDHVRYAAIEPVRSTCVDFLLSW